MEKPPWKAATANEDARKEQTGSLRLEGAVRV